MQYRRVLEQSTQVPEFKTIQRPNCTAYEGLLVLAVCGDCQRHFSRMTLVSPYALALWTDELCLVLDMERGAFMEVRRRLFERGYIYLTTRGLPNTFQELDAAVMVPVQIAKQTLDIARISKMVRDLRKPLAMMI